MMLPGFSGSWWCPPPADNSKINDTGNHRLAEDLMFLCSTWVEPLYSWVLYLIASSDHNNVFTSDTICLFFFFFFFGTYINSLLHCDLAKALFGSFHRLNLTKFHTDTSKWKKKRVNFLCPNCQKSNVETAPEGTFKLCETLIGNNMNWSRQQLWLFLESRNLKNRVKSADTKCLMVLNFKIKSKLTIIFGTYLRRRIQ